MPDHDRPFFIVGNPRSGTTLLRLLTTGHPRLYVTESGFIPYLRVPPAAPLSRAQVRRALLQVGRLNRYWALYAEQSEEFYDALEEPTLGNALSALYRKRAAGAGAERWGDRTASYVSHMDLLSRIFPSAQFIHIVRDGRDTVLSALKAMGKGRSYMDSYYLLRHWVRRVEAGRRDGRALGDDRYLEVRYEDLVSAPEAEMRRISDFLGEEFDARMLSTEVRKQKAPTGTNLSQPISTGSVGRWRQQMSDFDKKLANRLAGEALQKFGYELADLGPMTPAERLRCVGMAAKFVATDTVRSLLYKARLRATLMSEVRPGKQPVPAEA